MPRGQRFPLEGRSARSTTGCQSASSAGRSGWPKRPSIGIGYPRAITVDNGPEFVSATLDQWAHAHGVQLIFSRPGKPVDNAFIESFNGRVRDECLNTHWFYGLEQARHVLAEWLEVYNNRRPHSSLAGLTPAEYETQHRTSSVD